jgi:hypothetical protein
MGPQNATERIREFIRLVYNEYAWFETLTGISASKWRDLDRGKTKAATAEMIEAACKTWPEFAFWFVTGDTTCTRGQTSPHDYFYFPHGVISTLDTTDFEIQRSPAGQLLPDRSDLRIKDKLSREYELSVINGFLLWSALVNHHDADKLSPHFHEEFVAKLPAGATLKMKLEDVKNWVNRHPVTPEITWALAQAELHAEQKISQIE